MKIFTSLALVFFCASFIVTNYSAAQVSNISSDPSFNKGNFTEASFIERIKAKEHIGALAFNYAKDAILENKLRKVFTIEINDGGEYFLSAYVNAAYDVPNKPAPEMVDKKYPLQQIAVYIDNESVGNLDISKSGWCSAKLKTDKKIMLSTGKHEVVFESNMPNTPNVDVIKLSKNFEKAMFDNTEYEK
ncbi:MAG: hypothetical protein ACK5HT_17860, partial [Draconibacterium sp.]